MVLLRGASVFFEDSGMGDGCQGTTMRKSAALPVPAWPLAQQRSPADVFRFAYTKGEKYRIVSQVHESVYVNGQFSHESGHPQQDRGRGHGHPRRTPGYHDVALPDLRAGLRLRGRRTNGARSTRPSSGATAGAPTRSTLRTSCPMVRDVPLFPEGDVQPGEHVDGEGERGARFPGQLRHPGAVPVPHHRELHLHRQGDAGRDRVRRHHHRLRDLPHGCRRRAARPGCTPSRVAGDSHQKFWWDIAGRRPLFDEETLRFRLHVQHGRRGGVHSATSEGRLDRSRSPWTGRRWRGTSRSSSTRSTSPTSRCSPPTRG